MVIGAVVQLFVYLLTHVLPSGLLGELLLVGGGGLAGTAIYGLLAILMGIEEVGMLGLALRDWSQRLTGLRR